LEWEHWNQFDGEKLINNEIFELDELKEKQLGTGETFLTDRKWFYCQGMWVYFKIDEQKYENIKSNQSILEDAIKSWKKIERWRSYTLFRQQWWQWDSVEWNISSTDKDAKIFLECDSSVRKNIDLSWTKWGQSSNVAYNDGFAYNTTWDGGNIARGWRDATWSWRDAA